MSGCLFLQETKLCCVKKIKIKQASWTNHDLHDSHDSQIITWNMNRSSSAFLLFLLLFFSFMAWLALLVIFSCLHVFFADLKSLSYLNQNRNTLLIWQSLQGRISQNSIKQISKLVTAVTLMSRLGLCQFKGSEGTYLMRCYRLSEHDHRGTQC